MSNSQSYTELNHVFVTLQNGLSSEVNALYDHQGANFTDRIHNLFKDIGIVPRELDVEQSFAEYADYLRFTKPSYDSITQQHHITKINYSYMLPYPNDLTLLLNVIKDLVFSSNQFNDDSFLLLNRIIEFIHLKVASKKTISGYDEFINDLHRLYPIIQHTFQKNPNRHSLLLYSIRNLISSHVNQNSKDQYPFLQDTLDDVFISYGIMDIYLEFNKEDFYDVKNSSKIQNGGSGGIYNNLTCSSFDQVRLEMLEGIDTLIIDIKNYLSINQVSELQTDTITNLLFNLIFHFKDLRINFEDAKICRKEIIRKIVVLCDELGQKRSDYLDFISITKKYA